MSDYYEEEIGMLNDHIDHIEDENRNLRDALMKILNRGKFLTRLEVTKIAIEVLGDY